MQIRLLRLEPPSPDHNDHVFSLAVHDFDEENYPSYIAISYTWGLPVPLLPIVVNGQKVKVHLNCWYALWQMRHHGYTDQNFWVDSLCINQSDDHEKSVQVSMMGAIYSSAQWVASCLGIGDGIGSLQEILKSKDSDAINKAGEKLLQLSYFERVWIKQETFLARDIKLFCGADKISGTEFGEMSEVAKWMRERQRPVSMSSISSSRSSSYSSDSSLPETETETETKTKNVSTRHVRSAWSPERVTFVDVILEYQKAKATEPKDKIYALLSLVSKDDIVRQKLPIVYGKGASFPLLRTVARLLFSGYKEVAATKKIEVLRLVVEWLSSGIKEEHSSRTIHAMLRGPRREEEEEYAEIEIDGLRLIHEDKEGYELGKSQLRIEATASKPSDISRNAHFLGYDTPNRQGRRSFKRYLPSDLKTMKILYNYQDDDKIPRSEAVRTTMFYVNADVGPGDVLAVLLWGQRNKNNMSHYAYAILRPVKIPWVEKEPKVNHSSHLGYEADLPHRSVYVFHSWAVPGRLHPTLTLQMLFRDETGANPLKILSEAWVSQLNYDSISRKPEMKGNFKLHYDDILMLLLTHDDPLQSLLHPSTRDDFGWNKGVSFFEEHSFGSDYSTMESYMEKGDEEDIRQEVKRNRGESEASSRLLALLNAEIYDPKKSGY
ncbi:het domain protein [Colletotrichum truncatum]|uniref:Het domain protein n=1 Tax=Colletotrichum truncatum TaxID=5467 RepID=A0ACC3YSI1_COLTU|nr:het domain protein [Colletotrichum truncatum]KAF6789806.1 het domain protein [Colletotrichum truncatum]